MAKLIGKFKTGGPPVGSYPGTIIDNEDIMFSIPITPDYRKNALQNSEYDNWQDAYAEYSGKNGSWKERRNFKRDWKDKENVKARVGENTYDQLRSESEQKQFGTQGYNSGSEREKRRFDRRFNRQLRNDKLALSPKSPAATPTAPTAPTPTVPAAQGQNSVIYPWNWDTYQIRPRGGMFLQSPVRTSYFQGTGNSPELKPKVDDDYQQRIQNEHLMGPNPDFVSPGTYFNIEGASPLIKHSSYGNLSYTPTATSVSTTPTSSETSNSTSVSSKDRIYDINNSEYFRSPHAFANGNGGFQMITVNGKQYPIAVTKNMYGKVNGFENDQTYAYDKTTGKFIKVKENMFGVVKGGFDDAQFEGDWFDPNLIHQRRQEWLKTNPEPEMRPALGGSITPEWKEWAEKYKEANQLFYQKQGGKMNKIKYFQQGGTMNQQQDVQQQVIQLVQAAMQGDQKATETINQIMQAAQMAPMIQQVIEQMKGQANMAKQGSKLRYIKSLKYAKGGKTCPSCQNEDKSLQTPFVKKSAKKAEEKACGGKVKKRYFGGYI